MVQVRIKDDFVDTERLICFSEDIGVETKLHFPKIVVLEGMLNVKLDNNPYPLV